MGKRFQLEDMEINEYNTKGVFEQKFLLNREHDREKLVDSMNKLHEDNMDLLLICQRQADFLKSKGYGLKSFLDFIKDTEEQSCSTCEYMVYQDNDGEEMDCIHGHATPDNGAPEMISSDSNECPFYETRQERSI